MAFTYDVTSDLGKVRLEIGDRVSGKGVRPDNSNFSDEEITEMLTVLSNDVQATAARLLAVLSREWALVSDITLGPRREKFSDVSKQYAALSKELLANVGGGVMSVTVGFIRDDEYAYRAQWTQYPTHDIFVPYHMPGRVEYS